MRIKYQIFTLLLFLSLLLFACNNETDKTVNQKTPEPAKTDSLKEVGLANMYISEKEAEKYIKNFRKLFRNNDNNDSLSRSVWLDKEVIRKLSEALQNSGNNLDGVRLYFAAYDKKIHGTRGKHENQATLILVPTSDSLTYHADRWNILTKKFDKKILDALNHGSLCPDDCYGMYY